MSREIISQLDGQHRIVNLNVCKYLNWEEVMGMVVEASCIGADALHCLVMSITMNEHKTENEQGMDMFHRSIWQALLTLLAAVALSITMAGIANAQTQTTATKTVEKVLEKDEAAVEDAASTGVPKPNLSSPGYTVKTFIEAMYNYKSWIDQALDSPEERDQWQDNAIACLWIKGTDYETDRDAAFQVAEDLYATMNLIREYDLDHLISDDSPFGDADYADPQTKKEEIVLFPMDGDERDKFEEELGTQNIPRISLEKNEDGQWKFDPQTVERAGRIFKQFESKDLKRVAGPMESPIKTIESALPKYLVDGKVMNIKYWQWLLVLILIFLGMVIDFFFRILVKTSSQRLIRRRGITEEMQETIRYSARPFGLLAAAVFWILTVKLVFEINKDNLAVYVLYSALRIYIAVIGTMTAWRFVDLMAMILEAKAKHTTTKFDDVLIPLMRKTFKIFVVAIGIVYAAGALGVSIAPLLASIGIASVGISFAMKDTVENFFGSVAVLMDRPFDVGDWVVIDSAEGIVEQVGFRSTRIRTFYNSQITIPNANLVRAKVDNYGRRKYRRWKTNLSVQYDTTPEQLIAFTEGVRELVRTHPYTRKDYYEVYCNEFGDSSLDILLYIFFEVPDWNTELRERERMFLDIVRLADALGVSFAFPTRTLHMYNEDKDAIHKPSEVPLSSTERRAEVLGVHAAQRLMKNQSWKKKKPGAVVITGAPTDIKLDDAGNPVIEDDKEDEV